MSASRTGKMRKIKRIAALLLALLILAGCGGCAAPQNSEARDAEVEQDKKTDKLLALVPIDDRPDNVECAVYIAQMVGYEIVTPEQDLYSTKLNNQPLNENGTRYGDRAALYEWVLQMEAEGCDRYVICLDQLLSGGLVSSRDMTKHEDIELSDGTKLGEFELLRCLIDTLAADENNRVWFLDTVMRLAPTVGYLEWTLDDYYAIRKYAAVPRPDLKKLKFENLSELYRLNEYGKEIDPAWYGIDEKKLDKYMLARQRKIDLASELLSILNEPGHDNFRVIFGIDDSSEKESIQENEIACIKKHLRDCDSLLSGVDDLEFKAISRLYLDDIGWQGDKAMVRYFGDNQDIPACDYDYRALDEIVDEHMDFFDLKESDDANLQILVLTSPAKWWRTERYCNALIDAINENEENHIPTILIDASNAKYGSLFRDKLKEEAHSGWLIGYAGFLDMSIVTGSAFSRGVARYAMLKQGEASYSSNIAFMQMMTDAFVRDYCYIGECKNPVNTLVEENGGDALNFYEPEIDADEITDYMVELMDEQIPSMVENLQGSQFICSLDGYKVKDWNEIELTDYNFPWNRTFELRVDIMVDGIADANVITIDLEETLKEYMQNHK